MAIAYNVGAAKGVNYNTPAAAQTTPAVTTTGGSGSVFLIYCYHYDSFENDNFTSIADSKSNSYTQIGSTYYNGNNASRLYYCAGGTGGSSHTATVTYANAGFGTGIIFLELIGCATTNPIDQYAIVFDNATPFSSGATSTTTQAAEMLVGFFRGDSESNGATNAVDASSAPTSGWTVRAQLTEFGSPNRELAIFSATTTVSSTGAYSFAATQTGSGEGHAAIVTVKEGSSGASIAPRAAYYQQMLRRR